MTDGQSSNRRDFLKGKSVLDAVRQGDIAKLAVPDFAEQRLGQARQESYLEQYSKAAMACQFEIYFNMQQYSQSGAAAAAGFELIDALEDQLTVYRDHSEVSRMNEAAFQNKFAVSENLFELLSRGLEIYQWTGGAFDMTAGKLSELWGFEKRAGKVPTKDAIAATLLAVGSDKMRLDLDDCSVRFTHSDLKVNLGGIGKGFALDAVASRFRELGVRDFLIHGGQSSVLAGGHSTEPSRAGHATNGQNVDVNEDAAQAADQPVDAPTQASESTGADDGWFVGLSHPTVPGKRLAEIRLTNQALGTSGTGRQGFFHQGKRYGHILDPRTGWPTSHFLSTTVLSKSAATSDALATAFFVMTLDQVHQFCDAHRDISAIVVSPAPKGRGNALEISTFNLPDRDWRRTDSTTVAM